MTLYEILRIGKSAETESRWWMLGWEGVMGSDLSGQLGFFWGEEMF